MQQTRSVSEMKHDEPQELVEYLKSNVDLVNVVKAVGRSIGASSPGFATWVQAWNDHESLKLKRRVDNFWKAFVFEAQQNSQKLEAVEKSQDNLVSRLEMIARILEHVRTEFSELKQGLYAAMAINCLTVPDSEVSASAKMSAIDCLNQLNEQDLNVLHYFRKGQTIQVKNLTRNLSLGQLVVSLSKQESRGLIGETSSKGGIHTAAATQYWEDRWKHKFFELLPYGQQMVTLLEQSDH